MTARRLVLAWSAGATVGLVVGWVYGSHVQRLTEAHRLGRERREADEYWATVGRRPPPETIAKALAVRAVRVPGPRAAPPTGVETPEPRTGAQIGAQRCGDVEPYSHSVCSREAGHCEPHGDGLWSWGTHKWRPGEGGGLIEHWRMRHLPAQRDEPCPQYSPGGGVPCSVTGPHTAHVFLGSTAPDRKADADEEVE